MDKQFVHPENDKLDPQILDQLSQIQANPNCDSWSYFQFWSAELWQLIIMFSPI